MTATLTTTCPMCGGAMVYTGWRRRVGDYYLFEFRCARCQAARCVRTKE